MPNAQRSIRLIKSRTACDLLMSGNSRDGLAGIEASPHLGKYVFIMRTRRGFIHTLSVAVKMGPAASIGSFANLHLAASIAPAATTAWSSWESCAIVVLHLRSRLDFRYEGRLC